MTNPAYYAIIPADVRYDKTLCPNAKLLYGELTALTNKEGYCWASNSYFASLYGVHKNTISKWVKALQVAGYIFVELEVSGNQGKFEFERKIYIAEKLKGGKRKAEGGVNEIVDTPKRKAEHNNTVNNTVNSYGFKPPTPEELTEYLQQQQIKDFTANTFIDYYQAKGWMIGKNKMKDWKAAVRTWKARKKPEQNKDAEYLERLKRGVL